MKLKPAPGTVIQAGAQYALGKAEGIADEPVNPVTTLQDTKSGAMTLGTTGVARNLQSM